jgi:hypothetical protein
MVAQAGKWPWAIPLAAVGVLWNPVFPFDFEGDLWLAAQYLAAILFIAVAVLVKVVDTEAPRRG